MPRLLQRAEPLRNFGSLELRELLADMRDTMRALNGAGLAAPQIGVGLRCGDLRRGQESALSRCRGSTADCAHQSGHHALSDEMEEGWEGCLSVPGMRGLVPRYTASSLSGLRRKRQRDRPHGERLSCARGAARMRPPRWYSVSDAHPRSEQFWLQRGVVSRYRDAGRLDGTLRTSAIKSHS